MSGHKRVLKITWRQTWPIWLTFGLLFGFGVFGVLVLIPGTQRPTKVLAQGEDVKLASGDLERGEPRLFEMPLVSAGKVKFFIERGADDNITVAFASCRKCYRSGHYRQGSQIFCGRCSAPMERLGRGQTPASGVDCTQIPVPFERSGDSVLIRASAVSDAFAQWYVPTLSQDKAQRRAEMRYLMSLPTSSIALRMILAIAIAMPLAQSAVQQTLTKKELKTLTASAKTAADHGRLADYYRSEAKRLEAKQREHEQELAKYYENPLRYPSKYPTMGDHCRSLAAYYRMAAVNANAQADMHERLAQDVR